MDEHIETGKRSRRKHNYCSGCITNVARMVGVSRPTVYRYLNGTRKFDRLEENKRKVLEMLCQGIKEGSKSND